MYSAIILGGGQGIRLGLDHNKVLKIIKGKTMIEWAVKPFIDDQEFTEVIVVSHNDDRAIIQSLFDNIPKVKVVLGGTERQDSVNEGLKVVSKDFVFIHDGARPLLDANDILALKDAVKDQACTLFTKPKDSLAFLKNDQIVNYIDRTAVALIQTPQAFMTNQIKEAYRLAFSQKHYYSDDASLYFYELNLPVKLIEGSDRNIKITRKFDLDILEEII